MRRVLSFIKNKTSLLGAVAIAAVVGGATSAVVMAAIPDSSGTVHACYRNSANLTNPKGSLRVIDTGSGGSCTGQETALDWSQNGPTILRDAGGQILGDIVGYSSNYQGGPGGEMHVYNHTIGLVVPLAYDGSSGTVKAGELTVPVFASNNCSGQAYTPVANGAFIPIETMVSKWSYGASDIYAKVSSGATTTNITYGSQIDAGTNTCDVLTGLDSGNVYPFTAVTLPFTTPVATPFKF